MKIAIVDPAAFTLPYDSALCEALAAAGHDVTLFTTRFAHGSMPDPAGYERVEWFYRRSLRPLPRRVARGLQHPRDMRRLLRHLRREHFDVVHVQWSVIDRVDVPLWRSFELPTVFTAHNSVGRAEALGDQALGAFDAVVAHSEFGARGIRDLTGWDEQRVWHVPHGAFHSYRSLPDPASPPLELGPGPVVSLAGLLRPYKGVDVLLAAWTAVRAAVPDAQLVIAGRPMGVDLPEPAPDGATFLPRFLDEDEFAWLLRRTDVVCLPYRAIDLSGVLFAGLALGRPLVLTGVGGFAEFAGSGAELVPPDDPDALAATLIHLLQDDARRAELAEESLRAANEHYSWTEIARRYGDLYADLSRRTTRAPRSPAVRS